MAFAKFREMRKKTNETKNYKNRNPLVLYRLLLDCNETEQEIIIRTARELKATLVSLGI